jgi:hypothetical protein
MDQTGPSIGKVSSAPAARKQTMLSLLLDTITGTGSSRTRGVADGEKAVSSESRMETPAMSSHNRSWQFEVIV